MHFLKNGQIDRMNSLKDQNKKKLEFVSFQYDGK